MLKTLAICIIAYASDRPSTSEIRTHELAHANGWVHKEQTWLVPPKGYVAEKPPVKFIHEPHNCTLVEKPLPTKDVQQLCQKVTGRASYGCQWFE